MYWKILKDIERYWKILKGWELHRAAWRGHAVTRPFNRFAHLVSRFLVAEGMNSSFICRAQSNVSKAETSWISFFEAFLSALGRHTSRSTSCTPTTCKERFKYEHVPQYPQRPAPWKNAKAMRHGESLSNPLPPQRLLTRDFKLLDPKRNQGLTEHNKTKGKPNKLLVQTHHMSTLFSPRRPLWSPE